MATEAIVRAPRDTAVNWGAVNPILKLGELGLETDTNLLKPGNGIGTYSGRPYITARFIDILGKPTTLSGYGITDAQGINANLTAISGQTTIADRLTYWTGSGTAGLTTFTAAGRTLVGGADAAAQRATLDLTIGTVGNVVPKLNGAATTWVAGASFGGRVEATSTAAEQMKASYDASNYTTITTNSAGNVTISPTGGNVTFNGAMTETLANSAVILTPAGGGAPFLSLNNSSNTAGNTASLRFLGSAVVFTAIETVFKTRTGGAQDGILTFTTRGAGTLAERMRMDETGLVKVNGAFETGGRTTLGGALKHKAYTIATLPVSPSVGDKYDVTDALAPAWGAVVAAGGSKRPAVKWDGTNWIVE